jgi:5-methylcytosine-specific restriction protein B
MNTPLLDPRIREELKTAIDRGQASGEMMASQQINEHTKCFRYQFGPDVLRGVDGENFLLLMHGRQDSGSRCLAYWLEFKDDDEFAGYHFGGIGGGSALKYGIYQRQSDGAWMGGSGSQPQVITLDDVAS